MLQPDLFFSYGLSSGLALAAQKKLRQEENPWVNKYFLATLVWLSVLYIPQVLYLLWRFPAWESMFAAKDYSDYPAWFLSVYNIVTIGMGALGFRVTYHFIRQGRLRPALAQVGWSMGVATLLVFVGWDGTGLKRLLYVGTGAEWASGVVYPATDFFTSPVFHTLLWLEALVLIPYFYLALRWARER